VRNAWETPGGPRSTLAESAAAGHFCYPLDVSWRMIFSENRLPLFGIMLEGERMLR